MGKSSQHSIRSVAGCLQIKLEAVKPLLLFAELAEASEAAGIAVVQFHSTHHEFGYDGLTKAVAGICSTDSGDITHEIQL